MSKKAWLWIGIVAAAILIYYYGWHKQGKGFFANTPVNDPAKVPDQTQTVPIVPTVANPAKQPVSK